MVDTPQPGVAQPDDLFRLDGRVAVITGASSGLGARFAKVLHAAGATLVLTARRKERLDHVADELGSRVTVVPGDLRDDTTRAAVMAHTQSQHQRLDILINNAGVCDAGPLHARSLGEITDVLNLNVVAAIDMCRRASLLLFRQPGSAVINVASIFGLVGSQAPMTGYNTSKGALVQFTRHLAAQWGERGVRVNALAPGFFPTELTGGLSHPAQRASIEQRTSLGRIPDLAEIDGPLLFLVSDAASYVTGQVLVVDGGWTAT